MSLFDKLSLIENDYFKTSRGVWAKTLEDVLVYDNNINIIYKFPIEDFSFEERGIVFINSCSGGEPLILVLHLDNEVTITEFNEEHNNAII